MSLASFLRSLFEDGRVRVPALVPLPESDLAAAERELTNFERLHRLEMPGQPPALDLVAARWAAVVFFRACQFTVYRDLHVSEMGRELGQCCPHQRSPVVDYSVDVVYRFLPGLLTLARSASENDPLVGYLRGWARDWPLSSVGIADLGAFDVSSFVHHPALRALYVDRIIAAGDASRLSEERVRQAVESAVGLHRVLAGNLPLNRETPA